MERFLLGFSGIESNRVLAAFAAVITAAQVDRETADGRIKIRLPCLRTADKFVTADFFDQFDHGVLKHILSVLMRAGLLAGEEQ